MSGVNVVDIKIKWLDDTFDTAHVPMGHRNFYDGDIYWLQLGFYCLFCCCFISLRAEEDSILDVQYCIL